MAQWIMILKSEIFGNAGCCCRNTGTARHYIISLSAVLGSLVPKTPMAAQVLRHEQCLEGNSHLMTWPLPQLLGRKSTQPRHGERFLTNHGASGALRCGVDTTHYGGRPYCGGNGLEHLTRVQVRWTASNTKQTEANDVPGRTRGFE